MSVIPFDRGKNNTANTKAEAAKADSSHRGFWQWLGGSVDSLFSYSAQHSLAERQFSQIDAKIDSCRRLMAKPQRRREAVAGCPPVHRAIRAAHSRG